MPKHQVSCRIDERDYAVLAAVARDEDRSVAQVVRRIINSALIEKAEGRES